MENINVLLLSVGRRVELLKEFKKAAKELNILSNIVTADISNTAPASFFADKAYIIPRIGDDNYIASIIDICNKESINLIVPTIDTELLILSENREKIEKNTKAKVLVSDVNVIKICRNKTHSQKFFEENHFGVPKQIDINFTGNQNLKFPMFIKPEDGSSSVNTFKVENMEELQFFSKYIKKPIIQEYIIGTEYTVDAFLNFSSEIISIVPRERIATRGGEIIKGRIVKDKRIIDDVTRLLKILKPIGQITIQCMKTVDEIKYIEINPRFGGGAPMSIKAGANSCKNLYKLLQGKSLDYTEDYRENIMFLRFDDAIMLNENMEIVND